MKVYAIAIASVEWLAQLAAYLHTVEVPPFFSVHNSERGDWRRDIADGPPTDDRPKPIAYRRQFMKAPALFPSFPPSTMVSALNYYPVGGGGLGWHTDSHAPGWRIYIARPLTATPGILMADDDGGRSYDDVPGLARAFYVSGQPGASWHAVVAHGPRLSMGVRIRSMAVARSLGLPT